MAITYLNSKMIEVPAELSILTTTELSVTRVSSDESTFNKINVQNLVADFATISATNYNVEIINVNPHFLSINDLGKAFHYDTTTAPVITAVMPPDLPNGFNFSIFNSGTGIIYLSSANNPFINARGQSNETAFTGMFIYKVGTEFYGVGVFE